MNIKPAAVRKMVEELASHLIPLTLSFSSWNGWNKACPIFSQREDVIIYKRVLITMKWRENVTICLSYPGTHQICYSSAHHSVFHKQVASNPRKICSLQITHPSLERISQQDFIFICHCTHEPNTDIPERNFRSPQQRKYFNKVNHGNVWFPSAYKSYVYTIL